MTLQQLIENANQLVANGKYEDAIREFELHSQELGNESDYHQHLAMLYLKQGNKETARLQLKKAFDIAPNNPVIRNNYGVLLYQAGQYETSRKYFETAVMLDNQYVEAVKNLKMVRLDIIQQKIEKAFQEKNLGKFHHLTSFVYSLKNELLNATKISVPVARWKSQTDFGKDFQKQEILIVAGAPRVELAKMSDALRRTGKYKVRLLCAQNMSQNVGGFYTQFFDEIIGYQNQIELIYFLLAIEPDLVIGRSKFHAISLACIFSDAPVVFHAYDIYRFSRPPEFSNILEVEGEQFSFENADGIIHKGHEDEIESYIRPLYHIKSPVLHFHPFCWEPYFVREPMQKLSDKDGELHIVYTGLVEPPSTDKRFNGEVHFLETAQKIADQNIHFHIYYSPHLGTNDDYYREYFDFAGQNPYFHFHTGLPYEKLCKEISQYDYGWNVFDYRYAIMPDTWRRLLSTNKIFTYLEAGIPMIVGTRNDYVASLVKEWQAGIDMDWFDLEQLSSNLAKLDYKSLQSNVLNIREKLSVYQHIDRLETFFNEVIKGKENT